MFAVLLIRLYRKVARRQIGVGRPHPLRARLIDVGRGLRGHVAEVVGARERPDRPDGGRGVVWPRGRGRMASAGADDGEMDMNGQNKTSRGGCGGKGHLPWGWARERAWALGQELTPDPRELPLDQVTGGVLGADVRALAGLPAFDAAAMDGFAVSGQGPWRLVGRRMAGAAEEVCAGLGSGEAVEIAT